MGKLPVAVQVYSVRDDAAGDFLGTMKAIKAMGYDGVELGGLYGMSATEMRAALDEAGLTAIGAHVPFSEITGDIHAVIRDYQILGCAYIAIPYLVQEERPGSAAWKDVLARIASAGTMFRDAGIQLLYHNHDFEFVRMPDGTYGLDDLYKNVPADILKTELDTCWIKVAGEDPAQYVEKYAGRCPLVHLKDFYKSGLAGDMYELMGIEKKEAEKAEGVFEFRPLGEGLQDMPSILNACRTSGAEWVVVEQDASVGRTPMEAIKMSRDYLRSQGW